MRKKFTSKVRIANAIADLNKESITPYFNDEATQYVLLRQIGEKIQIERYLLNNTAKRISQSNVTLQGVFSLPLSSIIAKMVDGKITYVKDLLNTEDHENQ